MVPEALRGHAARCTGVESHVSLYPVWMPQLRNQAIAIVATWCPASVAERKCWMAPMVC